MPQQLHHWLDTAGPLPQALAGLGALIAALALILLLVRATRSLRGKKAADTLTVVAAAMASSVAATGMWHFFSRTMHLPVWIQAVLFAFMEISVLASALRARANVARDGQAGADGIAVWVLTSASGLMSASEANSPQEALVRLGAPLVAAWLWERSMVPERRARRAAEGRAETVRWLLSFKRLAVRLGLATALGANLETEDANRRIDRFVRADNRAQRAGRLTRRRAGRRRDRAHARLMEQARMQADPRALYAHLGRQAILDVLARLGGDDAVIDRERARHMRHILADALDEDTTPGPAGSRTTTTAAPTNPAAADRRQGNAFAPGSGPVPAPAGHDAYDTPNTDELPLTLPALISAAEQAITTAPFQLPAARHAPRSPAPNPPYRNGANGRTPYPPQPQPTPAPTPAATPKGVAAATATTSPGQATPQTGYRAAPAREQILAPVRFVAAALPDPEPAYPDDDPEPAPLPAPAATPNAFDPDLAERITRIMAESPIPPNLVKMANTLNVDPADLQAAVDALGGFEAVWSRARQDREAELGDTDPAFHPA